MIVNYNIRIWPKGADKEKDATYLCLTARDFENNNRLYKLSNYGTFKVRVQAVSTAGPGNYTNWIDVSIQDDSQQMLLLSILLPVCIILILLSICVIYCLYTKNRSKENGGTFSWNDNYFATECVYQEDDWEVEREAVKYDIELGNGAFGKVYKGVYHRKEGDEVPVAVKTVHEKATLMQKWTFLREASAMK